MIGQVMNYVMFEASWKNFWLKLSVTRKITARYSCLSQ